MKNSHFRRDFLARSAASLAVLASRPLSALAAPDSSRVALVVGNDRYARVPLGNAANDARAMADLLRDAGFGVDAQIDASGEAMRQSVAKFGEAIARPDVKLAFFYYAGHGVQVDWRNYLLPVDANVASADDLKRQCLDMGVLLAALAKAKGKEYVVLDACRDNPLGAAWRPEQKGLSQFDAPAGSLIAFSTAPGNVASDGGGRHGLYTENLVRELAVKGARIEDALKRVRVNVRLASQGAQIPWESTSLEDDVYIYPPQGEATPDPERRFAQELERWNGVKRSRNPEDWAAFVRDFPNGKFSEIAQSRLNQILKARERARGNALVEKRGANPYSAGTYPLDRNFTVGDEATYREIDPDTGRVRRQYSTRVTAVDVESDRVEYNGGSVITDLLGNPIRTPRVEFDVPVQMNPAELQVGHRWQARYHLSRERREVDVEAEFVVAAREKVVVPAGEFDAFRIEGRGGPVDQRLRRRAVMEAPMQVTIWDVPGLNFVVKRLNVNRMRNRPAASELIELIRFNQASR